MSQWVIWQQEDRAFPCLRELHLRKCPTLKEALPCQLPSMTKLVIEGCDQLMDPFPRAPAIVELELQDKSRGIKYKRFERPYLHLSNLNCLDQILGQIQEMGAVFANLGELVIGDYNLGNGFEKNESIYHWETALKNFMGIHFLEIITRPSLVTFLGEFHAPNLTRLYLRELTNLKALSERMHSILPSLVLLVLDKCPQVESFPEGGLPSKLETLAIAGRHKLIAGPMQWNLGALPCLSTLTIGGYEDVMESFPETTLLPSTLTHLEIRDLHNLKSLDYKKLQHLPHLQYLRIGGCDKLEKMPEEGLPSSITFLEVGWMDNIKSLDSKGLQHLTCLRELAIWSSSELETITEEALPSSLRKLRIIGCSKLRYLPKEGLPSSLEYLELYDCGLLEEKCEWEGEYWPMISHFPRIQVHCRHLK